VANTEKEMKELICKF